jgi:hypothetical protein
MSRPNVSVLQILPRVPPAVCGIGDYAWSLARQLRLTESVESHFFCVHARPDNGSTRDEFPVQTLAERSASELLSAVKALSPTPSCIILHLSTYGFQKRGVPIWLASAWTKLSRLPKRPRLLVMFHELSASGPIHSSAFWLRPLQNMILRRIARKADAVRTNREDFATWLTTARQPSKQPVVTMPVFSNLGEPVCLPDWASRQPAMAVFGWGQYDGQSLASVITRAAAHCQKLGLSQLHVFGGGKLPVADFPGVQLIRHGFLPAEAISAILLRCRFAYSAYDPSCYGKSTLIAAFAAHGLALISQGLTATLPDGFQDGVHHLNENTLDATSNASRFNFEVLSSSLRGWYDQHSLRQNAASYANQIRSLCAAVD